MKKIISLLLPLTIFAITLGMTGAVNGAEYVGVKKCKICHIKQFKSWKETSMATSFENLKPGAKADAKKKAGLLKRRRALIRTRITRLMRTA
jgi:hypothetical protein